MKETVVLLVTYITRWASKAYVYACLGRLDFGASSKFDNALLAGNWWLSLLRISYLFAADAWKDKTWLTPKALNPGLFQCCFRAAEGSAAFLTVLRLTRAIFAIVRGYIVVLSGLRVASWLGVLLDREKKCDQVQVPWSGKILEPVRVKWLPQPWGRRLGNQ